MSESYVTGLANTPAGTPRRTVARGAAWAVPVVAAALAAPVATASATCTEYIENDHGTWDVSGPQTSGAGFRCFDQPAGPGDFTRYYYQPGSVLNFTWSYTVGESGLYAGHDFYIETHANALMTYGPMNVDNACVSFMGHNDLGGGVQQDAYEVACDTVPAGTVITWTQQVVLTSGTIDPYATGTGVEDMSRCLLGVEVNSPWREPGHESYSIGPSPCAP